MERICAWCEAAFPKEKALGFTGICQACWDELQTIKIWQIEKYVESLAFPVVSLDSEFQVQWLNEPALAMLGGTLEDAVTHPCGEFLGCTFAAWRGGCGGSMECSQCRLRQAVEATARTGEPNPRFATLLTQVRHESPTRALLLVTTVPMGDLVLMKLHQIDKRSRIRSREI